MLIMIFYINCSRLIVTGNKEIKKLYTSWRKAIRKLFDLPYITHCDLLPYICDDCPPNVIFSCYISM